MMFTEDEKNAELLNAFFSSAVSNLNVPEFSGINILAERISRPTPKAILKYKNHPSIVAINNFKKNFNFYFSVVSEEDFLKESKKLNPRKFTQSTNIPIKLLKENADIFASYLCDFFNQSIENIEFPSILKNVNITPLFKKGYRGSKENYPPVSILPVIFKIFEKLLCKKITIFMDPLLSKYQCGFRKGYSAQHCLLAMLEKWKNAVDKGKIFGALLTDFSKAFDSLSHDLLIAKLNAYGFSLLTLKLVHSYLSNRKQRTKIINAYRSWEEILFGVPQGSILGLILFNIFPSDLFLVLKNTDFASYADDNTIYDMGDSINDVIASLQGSSEKLFQWFSDNQLKGNTDKCHLIVSSDDPTEMKVGESVIKNNTGEKLLGINIDNKLTFDEHISGLCKKAAKQLRALARVASYMSLPKKKLLLNSFFNAQFNYYPLIWTLHSRSNNNNIKHLHERCFRIVYQDKQSSYENLLVKDGTVSMHHRNIQSLPIEMYKIKNDLSTEILSNVFTQRTQNHYRFRNASDFQIPFLRNVYHETEIISYFGPKIWDIVHAEMKNAISLNSFKAQIKKWLPFDCLVDFASRI